MKQSKRASKVSRNIYTRQREAKIRGFQWDVKIESLSRVAPRGRPSREAPIISTGAVNKKPFIVQYTWSSVLVLTLGEVMALYDVVVCSGACGDAYQYDEIVAAARATLPGANVHVLSVREAMGQDL